MPSTRPVSGSCTGAPEHVQPWTARLKCSAEKICTGWSTAIAVPTPFVPVASSRQRRPGTKPMSSDAASTLGCPADHSRQPSASPMTTMWRAS